MNAKRENATLIAFRGSGLRLPAAGTPIGVAYLGTARIWTFPAAAKTKTYIERLAA